MLLAWSHYLLLVLAAAILVGTQRQRRGTTLLGPSRWALAAILALLGVQLLIDLTLIDPARRPAWQLLAATSTFCPGIALLGAKRPQNQPWQWIVASLWLIIALPALQWLLLGKAGMLVLHPARIWFLLAVGLVSWTNAIFSRFGLAILVAAIGQVMLLAPFLSWSDALPPHGIWSWGATCMGVAVLLVWVGAQPRGRGSGYDRLWRDFRDRFGLVWSLRMMEQVNAVAESNGWDLTLQWAGFRTRSGSPAWSLPPEQVRVLRQSLHNLLRRFVSPEWIAARLPPPQHEPS